MADQGLHAGAEGAGRLDALIEEQGGDPSALIELLHRVQLFEGHLSPASLHRVARGLGLPLSHVVGVASFYHLFRRTPPPAHRCAVCFGTACFVNGAPRLLRELRLRMAEDNAAAAAANPSAAGATSGTTAGSEAGGWRLQRSGCLAACGQGAVLQLDDGPILRIGPEEALQPRLDALGLPPRAACAPPGSASPAVAAPSGPRP